MSVAEHGLRRLRMSWEDYLALADDVRAEWVDGEVVVSPTPSTVHQVVARRLTRSFEDHLPGLIAVPEAGLWLPHDRLRVPDVVVIETMPKGSWVEDVPILVVEVLSRTTRSEDLLRKAPEYADAGIGQLWVVDPARRSIDVQRNDEGRWADLLRLDDDHPVGSVTVGEHGVVPVDVREVFPA